MDDPTPAATPPEVAPPPRPRRRFALSLRALMLIVLVGGGLLGWKARRVSTQRRAVATIRAADGDVYYDHQAKPDGTWKSPSEPPAPAWLRRIVGDELFQEVVGVALHRRDPPDEATIEAYWALDRAESLDLATVGLADEQARQIAATPHLKRLRCFGPVFSPEGFRQVCRTADLDEFAFEVHVLNGNYSFSSRTGTGEPRQWSFRGSELVTAGDVAAVRSLAHLKRLWINDVGHRRRGLSSDPDYLPDLGAMRQLDLLEIWDRCLSDEDLRQLSRLDRLESLRINGTLVTDAGLAVAAGWPRLKALSFWIHNFERHRNAPIFEAEPPRLTDAGLAHLAGCRQLEKLSLIGARFADVGMATLAGLPALRELELDGFDATPAALGRLLAAHQFERLTLMGPGVGDGIVPLLAGQKALKELTLIGPGLTDAAAPGLARLPALESLKLTGSQLTDAGLAALGAAPASLRSIDLRATPVTPAGVTSFNAARPKTRVQRGPDQKSW